MICAPNDSRLETDTRLTPAGGIYPTGSLLSCAMMGGSKEDLLKLVAQAASPFLSQGSFVELLPRK